MRAIDVFRTFSYAIAAVIIAIEALVVFVTMMGSVNERTREIGIFRALGFRRFHVTFLMLIEAALASVLAGVLGYLAGMGAGYLLLPFFAEGLNVTVTWAPRARRGGGAARRAHRRAGIAVPRHARQPHGPDRRPARDLIQEPG